MTPTWISQAYERYANSLQLPWAASIRLRVAAARARSGTYQSVSIHEESPVLKRSGRLFLDRDTD